MNVSTGRPDCLLASTTAQLAADGLAIPEIARAMNLPWQRVLAVAVQFRIRSACKEQRDEARPAAPWPAGIRRALNLEHPSA
jgi:hypothetical protein